MRTVFGVEPYPWQQHCLNVGLEVLPDGTPAYDELHVLAPRRSGKTWLKTGLVARTCGGDRTSLAVATAQNGDKAVTLWRQVADQIARSPLGPQVKEKISNTHEELRWTKTDSRFLPFAPKEDAIHSEEPDLVIVDELWWFDLAAKTVLEDAWVPVFSVRPGQAWLLSAAGTSRSGWLKDAREKGREAVTADRGSGVAHFEWAIPENVGGVKASLLEDDELLDLVWNHHPRRDHGLRKDFLKKELTTSRPRFLRAYGGIDSDDSASETVIDELQWGRARTREQIPETALVGIGIGVDQDGVDASITAAWRRPDGVALTEQIAHRPGTRWVAPAVEQLVAAHHPVAVAINHVGPGRNVADELTTHGVELLKLGMGDWGSACIRFKSGVEESPISVSHDGHPDLEDSMRHAGLRETKTGLTMWAKTSEVTVTVLESTTAAVWAADHPGDVEPVKPVFRIF